MLFFDAEAPISVLVSQELSPAAKVMLVCLYADKEDAEIYADDTIYTPACLALRTGLSRPTVNAALQELEDKGWYISPFSDEGGTIAIRPLPHPQITLPGALLAEKEVNALGKVVYGLIQTHPDFKHPSGIFSYYTLGKQLKVSTRKLETAFSQLVQTGWLKIDDASNMDKVQFTLCRPRVFPDFNTLDMVKRGLKVQGVNGKNLMHYYLSIIVDYDEGLLNAQLNFLLNPFTDELMRYDIYYSKFAVAIDCAEPTECIGTSPYTPLISIEEAERAMKATISKIKGITYIEITLDDLCYEKMLEKVRGHLPLREDVTKYKPSLNYLDKKSRSYAKSMAYLMRK